jgi:uncharacterized protein (TIGR03435 family)
MKCTIALLVLGLVSTSSPAQTTPSPAQLSSSPARSTGAAPLATAASPEFEAATIKPVKEPNPNRMNDQEEGRRFTTHYTSLSDLILMAYGVDRQQVAGGPGWVTADEYDVDAVGDGLHTEDGKQMVWQEMLQRLLADRFKLTFHWEQRGISSYELVVAKGGPKLKAADANEQSNKGCRGLGNCFFNKVQLAEFSRFMGFVVLDKPVVDKTGLEGEYDITLKWTPDESQFASMGVHVPPPVDNPNAPPGLFTAIEEQLGLKLEVRKTMTKVLVIDQAERPTEN